MVAFGDVVTVEGHEQRLMVLGISSGFECNDLAITADGDSEDAEGWFGAGTIVTIRLERAGNEPVGYVDTYSPSSLEPVFP